MSNLRIEPPAAIHRSQRAVGVNPDNQLNREASAADTVEMQFVAQMQSRLQAIAKQSHRGEDRLLGCIRLQNERDIVAGCLLLHRDGAGKLAVASQSMKDESLDVSKILPSLLEHLDSLSGPLMPMVGAAQANRLDCVVIPLGLATTCAMVVLVNGPLDPVRRSRELSLGQLQASFLAEADAKQRLAQSNRQVNATAATLELVTLAQSAATIRDACQQIASSLQQHWQCEQVIVGTSQGKATCRVQAVSNLSTIDSQAESTLQMKAALDECLTRGESGSWPPLPGIQPHQLLAHKQLAGRDSLVITTPLMDRDGNPNGAIALVGRRSLSAVSDLANHVAAVGEPLGATLQTVCENQKGIAGRMVAAMTADRHRFKMLAGAALVCCLLAILFVPMTYTISCRSLVEPVERQFCVSPHDGLLHSTLAEPGQLVTAGQLLAKMDGREIRWELAGVTAEIGRVTKQRDRHLANQETSQAIMADLELQRLTNQATLLQFKESNLDMTSPIAGIVLSGSLDRHENYPVSKGQVLYEVAPLDQLRIEVAIPADEIVHVEVGDTVDVSVDGFGQQTFQAAVDRIHPRAEIRENTNVFVAEVTIENPDASLRPGMRGTAKVRTDSRAIGWIAFHRAAEHFCAALPW